LRFFAGSAVGSLRRGLRFFEAHLRCEFMHRERRGVKRNVGLLAYGCHHGGEARPARHCSKRRGPVEMHILRRWRGEGAPQGLCAKQ
jgi:hypothetical protein